MDTKPTLPIPISLITQRYLLFDVAAVSYLRREHNICGVLIGSIPQSPSQNIFLGLPLELMPEEAKLLITSGVAYLIDDARAHDEMLHKADLDRREKYLTAARSEGRSAWKTRSIQKEQAFQKKVLQSQTVKTSHETAAEDGVQDTTDAPVDRADYVFCASATSSTASASNSTDRQAMGVTPATSSPLLSSSPSGLSVGDVSMQIYPLFRHLHARGFFLSPGLRFGCQYMAYPGDPLRYHSHFLVDGKSWDDEIKLVDIVAGGRLGTGVKKGYLLGGTDPEGQVKTFSIEWAGM